MSYTTHESLESIIGVLRDKLPELQWLLCNTPGPVATYHGTVEMLVSLIARYDRGEIIDLVAEGRIAPGQGPDVPTPPARRPEGYVGPVLSSSTEFGEDQ